MKCIKDNSIFNKFYLKKITQISFLILISFFSIKSQANLESDIDSFNIEENPLFENEQVRKKPRKKNKENWGFGLGISPTTIQIKDANQNRNLKGNNFVVRMSYDRPIQKKVNLLLGLSYLPLSGSQPDSQLGTAKFEVNYLSFEGGGRLQLSKSSLNGAWLGVSFIYLMNPSKANSNVIEPKSIKDKYLPVLHFGYNRQMDAEYLSFRLDWLLHTKTQTQTGFVNINQYILSAIYYY